MNTNLGEITVSIMKTIISTDYSDIEHESHIDEILSCHSTIDEATAHSMSFDTDNFRCALASYLKKSHEDSKKESLCICNDGAIHKSQSTLIEYFSGRDSVKKYLCERCGYVFEETLNRQMTTL